MEIIKTGKQLKELKERCTCNKCKTELIVSKEDCFTAKTEQFVGFVYGGIVQAGTCSKENWYVKCPNCDEIVCVGSTKKCFKKVDIEDPRSFQDTQTLGYEIKVVVITLIILFLLVGGGILWALIR